MKTFKAMFLGVAWLLLCTRLMAGPVDINTADATSLAAAIDGVGERRAAAIIAYRESHGPFASADDLANVKGIGASTVERNRDRLTVGTPAY